MKYVVWVSVRLSGCRVEEEIDIEPSFLEGFPNNEMREAFIEEYCREAVDNLMEWGYYEKN